MSSADNYGPVERDYLEAPDELVNALISYKSRVGDPVQWAFFVANICEAIDLIDAGVDL